jgi:hypothetical protein
VARRVQRLRQRSRDRARRRRDRDRRDGSDCCDTADCCSNGPGCDAFLTVLLLVRPLVAGLLVPARSLARHGERPGRLDLRGRLLCAVRLYQLRVSAARPARCGLRPTCSAYATQALRRHGVLRGGRLVVARLRRCRPGGPRGADPVPPL